MSAEKETTVEEANHGIAAVDEHSSDDHYPVPVAEGVGKTLGEGAQAREVRNAELFAAIQESNIERWSRTSIHLYFSVFVAFCCACANGYDGSLLGSIIAMKPFMNTFGTGLDGPGVSLIGSLYNVGSIITAPIGAWLTDRFGRKTGMFSGAIVIIVGAIIACTSSTIPQIVVGRFILGCGIAIMTVAAPAYSIEIAPPHWRGRCTGFYNCGWFGGSIPAAAITFGTSYINNNWSWRAPLLLQCFACVFVLGAVWFIPESPRYLMSVGKDEEAREFLIKYHGNGNPSSRLVKLEIDEIKEAIAQQREDKKSAWDYKVMVDTHNGRWRSAQMFMMAVFGQFSGNGLGYYNATIFSKIGINTTAQQLGYNLLNQVLSALGALTGVAFTDRMPRRKVLIFGTFACACLLATNAGTSAGVDKDLHAHWDAAKNEGDITNLNMANAALAFYFLFNTIYSFAYTPLQGVVPAESLDTARRAKGMALYGIVVGLMGFINTYAGPIALANIGYKYVYVFVAWDCIETLLWFFFLVEAQGRTLEQLEWVYNQPFPVKASQKVEKVVVQADGKVTEKVVSDAA